MSETHTTTTQSASDLDVSEGWPHPQTQVLLAFLANQEARTEASMEGISEDILDLVPGGDCQTIRGIVNHLLDLRREQLSLLDVEPQDNIPRLSESASVKEMAKALAQATDRVRTAVEAHDPRDWFVTPPTPRQGPWGADPTLIRFSRPLNDYTNHLGAIRAIRRMYGNPAARTQ